MWKVGNYFESLKEQQNRVSAIGWDSSPPGGNSESIRSCPGRVLVNDYKDAWYLNSQVELKVNPLTASQQVRSNLAKSRYVMWKKKSDRTKWERIGRPMFVETPLQVIEFTTEVLFKVGKLKTAFKKLTK